MVNGKQRTPLPSKKSPLKSVCHISLQWCLSNRWYGVCFTDSAGSISPLRLMMLQQVLSLGSPSTPAASKAARIVFPPQAGWDKRVCTIKCFYVLSCFRRLLVRSSALVTKLKTLCGSAEPLVAGLSADFILPAQSTDRLPSFQHFCYELFSLFHNSLCLP